MNVIWNFSNQTLVEKIILRVKNLKTTPNKELIEFEPISETFSIKTNLIQIIQFTMSITHFCMKMPTVSIDKMINCCGMSS